jgi:hypothetical protein
MRPGLLRCTIERNGALARRPKEGTISAPPNGGQGKPIQGFACNRADEVRHVETIVLSNDLVRLNFLASLLHDAGIACVVLDHHVSAIEGNIGAFPRRLAVAEADAERARQVLHDAGEA